MLDELREIARGIHPAALANGGLGAALKTLASRSAVPVHLDVRVDKRLAEEIELCAYYVISEALTNAAKHASRLRGPSRRQGRAILCCESRFATTDVAAPRFAHGTGLVGLKDRVEALGGELSLRSPRGCGTIVGDCAAPGPW